ncbi:hypothetical protein [Sphingomicrobium nitratireducens]|uniref:hypothetical protein n=1 Tax=Sphingomicrobium nitratireducens TaxID=2964666 RepID=UPI0022408C5D|nr:hypothetical protein [Sphingomicrobium nitratireducens]
MMTGRDSSYFERRAKEARGAADHKNGGRAARVAGHLALAYEALARIKRQREGLPITKH